MRRLYAGQTAKHKQLTAIERRKIEAYLSEGRSISWISGDLSCSKLTVFSEIIKREKYKGIRTNFFAYEHLYADKKTSS